MARKRGKNSPSRRRGRLVRKDTWHTKYGEVIMQSERGLHDTHRWYYPEWGYGAHDVGSITPRIGSLDGHTDRRVMQRRIQKYVDEVLGGEIEPQGEER